MYPTLLIAITVLEIILGLLIVLKNRRGKSNITFAGIILFASLWSIFNYLADNPIRQDLALLWNRLTFAVAFLEGAFLFYFASVFPFSLKKVEWASRFIILPLAAALSVVSALTSGIVSKVEFFDWGTNVEPGAIYGAFIGFMFVTVIGTLILQVIKFRRAVGLEKYQLRYLFIGFLSTAVIALTTNLFLPLVEGNNQLAKYGPLSMIFIIAFTVYAIVKHRLMDIRIVLRKVVLHVLISITLLAFILGAIFLVATLYAKRIPDYSLVFTGSIAMVIALLFLRPLTTFFERFANRYFFTSLYNYQTTLEDLARQLTSVIELNKVIDLIVNSIMKTMGLDRAGVLLLSSEKNSRRYIIAKVIGFDEQNGISLVRDNFLVQWLIQNKQIVILEELGRLIVESRDAGERSKLMRLKTNMTKIEASLCVPLFSKGTLISIIVLGNKVTKDPYTSEDLRLLESIANQAAVAVENAQSYQQVQDFSKTLQSKVNAQTHDIIAKNEQLERLLKAQSEFLDIASHQLRTPVSVIRGIVSMIQDGDMAKLPKAKQAEFIRSAAEKGAKLETIINDILSASELDSEKFNLGAAARPMRLEEVVDRAVEGFKLEAEQRGIDLEWRKPKVLPEIVGDAHMLEQAISNLISNALKYTPSTEMVKEARAKRDAKGKISVAIKQANGNLVVSVSDNGIGIPKDEIPKLFKKFSRASNATAMYTDGSGLGLFIIMEIVEGHKGKTWVESEENKGSTFFISLPIAR